LYRSIFPFGIIFLLAENFGSAFLAVLDSWWWSLSVFICLKKRPLFCFF
jgi:hypothetical protein